jgi:hypothetical protein
MEQYDHPLYYAIVKFWTKWSKTIIYRKSNQSAVGSFRKTGVRELSPVSPSVTEGPGSEGEDRIDAENDGKFHIAEEFAAPKKGFGAEFHRTTHRICAGDRVSWGERNPGSLPEI